MSFPNVIQNVWFVRSEKNKNKSNNEKQNIGLWSQSVL